VRECGASDHHALAALAPRCMNFSARQCWTISLSLTTSHSHLPPRHCGRVSQAAIVPYFQAPITSQSQTTGLLSRWCLTIALCNKWSDKISFFTEAHLPYQFSHCLPNPCTVLKAYRRCGLILQREMPVCHQGHLALPCEYICSFLSPF
jgi:hypothetical protein